ncbi:MAG: DUF2809 domain-containing protein [Bacteroidaceae bacterium]|jgi:hypothetical protein|nr:DUF2809 domain-containing protein [Bacteroidaceae bacterium]
MDKRRIYYLVALSITIAIGLLSRKLPFVPAETGDALWAVMVFCMCRAIMVRKRLAIIALLSLLISYCVEASQLIQWNWLTQLRSTTLGHLILGQGFLWKDIAAYSIGIATIYICALWFEKNRYN